MADTRNPRHIGEIRRLTYLVYYLFHIWCLILKYGLFEGIDHEDTESEDREVISRFKLLYCKSKDSHKLNVLWPIRGIQDTFVKFGDGPI